MTKSLPHSTTYHGSRNRYYHLCTLPYAAAGTAQGRNIVASCLYRFVFEANTHGVTNDMQNRKYIYSSCTYDMCNVSAIRKSRYIHDTCILHADATECICTSKRIFRLRVRDCACRAAAWERRTSQTNIKHRPRLLLRHELETFAKHHHSSRILILLRLQRYGMAPARRKYC